MAGFLPHKSILIRLSCIVVITMRRSSPLWVQFLKKRICDRAKEHDVALFGISELEKLLKLQEEIPLVSQDYKILFEYSGSIDLGLLEPAIARFRRTTKLLDLVLRALLSQNEDKEFGGVMSKRDIYWFMKTARPQLKTCQSVRLGKCSSSCPLLLLGALVRIKTDITLWDLLMMLLRGLFCWLRRVMGSVGLVGSLAAFI